MRLLALHLQVLDLRLVARGADGPRVVGAGRRLRGALAVLGREAGGRRRLEQSRTVRLDVVGRQRHLALVGRRAAQLHRAVDAAVLERQCRRVGQLIGTNDLQSQNKKPLSNKFNESTVDRLFLVFQHGLAAANLAQPSRTMAYIFRGYSSLFPFFVFLSASNPTTIHHRADAHFERRHLTGPTWPAEQRENRRDPLSFWPVPPSVSVVIDTLNDTALSFITSDA